MPYLRNKKRYRKIPKALSENFHILLHLIMRFLEDLRDSNQLIKLSLILGSYSNPVR